MQKARQNQIQGYRLEVWLHCNEKEDPLNKKIMAYLEDQIKFDLCKQALDKSDLQFFDRTAYDH